MSFINKIDFDLRELTNFFGSFVGLPVSQAVGTVEYFNGLVKESKNKETKPTVNALGIEETMRMAFIAPEKKDKKKEKGTDAVEAPAGDASLLVNKETQKELQQFVFPLEPKVSITAKNKIIRRYVNRKSTQGSIKERWVQDDFSVKIEGFLMDFHNNAYPAAAVSELKTYCMDHVQFAVSHEKLNRLGINRLAVQSLQMPYTPGLHAQKFTITAYSDQLFNTIVSKK